MRKNVAGLFISLDGVVESPEQWQSPYLNDEMGEAVGSRMAAADTMLLGRRTYQEFADYRPAQTGDEPFADRMNSTPKPVVSTTLETVGRQNSTLLNGDVAGELSRPKGQPGKNLAITGSGTLVRSPLRAGLLDELMLLVHPVVVGRGKRLFPDEGEQRALTLVDAKTFTTDVLSLGYAPAGP